MTTQYITCRVSGVSFEGRQALIATLQGNEPCRLEPEPTNPYDPNAIKVVVVTAIGPRHVGYVPRELAAQLAPRLEEEAYMVTFNRVTGGFKTWDGMTANLGMVLIIQLPQDWIE